jgi:hypothetical protein
VSDNDEDGSDAPRFTGLYRGSRLHTHAPADQLVLLLGGSALYGNDEGALLLRPSEAGHWRVLTKPSVQNVLKIKIPARY